MQMLFIFGAGAFLTWWFYLGLLNPYINAMGAIIKCAITAFFTLLINPLRPIIQRIHIPTLGKAAVFFLLGASILVWDHFYATKIYAEDQAVFYDFIIFGKKYWVMSVSLAYSGIFLFVGSLYLVTAILRMLNKLLDHPMQISIVINR
jgi:hypothetical protein